MTAPGRDPELALKIEDIGDRMGLPDNSQLRLLLRREARDLLEWDRGRRPVVATGAGLDALAARIADAVLDAIRPVLDATPEFHGLPWRDLIVAIVREHLTAGAIVEPLRDGREA